MKVWKVVIRKKFYGNFKCTGRAWFEDRSDAFNWMENNERFGMLARSYFTYDEIDSIGDLAVYATYSTDEGAKTDWVADITSVWVADIEQEPK